jgi:CrcB protein
MWKSVVAVCVGASLGALLRWALGAQFNSLWPELPPGTLLANLLGAYIIGLAIGFFLGAPGVAPEWRLLIITGFCGGLTTFSTFSGEVVLLLQQGRWGWAAATTTAHVAGSVLMTFAGIGTIMWARSA